MAVRILLCFSLVFFSSPSGWTEEPPSPAPAPPQLVDPVSSFQSSNAMVVTAHPAATQAALEVLQSGGNAVDAAIAAQWVLNVVEPQSSGIGGGGFFLYYDEKTKGIYTLDGREKAPIQTFPEMFLDAAGNPIRFYPERITGGLSVGVPATLKLLKRVHQRFGSKHYRFEELFDPAIRLAKEGIPVSKRLAEAIQEQSERLKLFEASRKIFFHPDGSPYQKNEILVQHNLAHTFETIAEKGIGDFYEGEIAKAIVQTVQRAPVNPGYLQRFDLQFYDMIEREPLHGNYRGYDIFTMGPPSSGGVALLEILNILENFSLIFYGASVDAFHLAIEAQKFAFEDRAKHLGDPDFVKIPLDKLISKDYAKKRAKEIKFDQARQVESLVEEASLVKGSTGNTSHISVRDSEGNIVSYTTTIEHVFGSAMVVPGWGFVLNNELTDFDAVPRLSSVVDSMVPKGSLINSAVSQGVKGKLRPNAPGPEKRPRSSMCPMIVFRNGLPILVAGSPGGSLIIPTVQEILMYFVDFKMRPEEVLAAPRFAAREGDRVEAESVFLQDTEVVNELKRRGHAFVLRQPFGNAQAIFFESGSNTFMGVSDPRGDGEAKGY